MADQQVTITAILQDRLSKPLEKIEALLAEVSRAVQRLSGQGTAFDDLEKSTGKSAASVEKLSSELKESSAQKLISDLEGIEQQSEEAARVLEELRASVEGLGKVSVSNDPLASVSTSAQKAETSIKGVGVASREAGEQVARSGRSAVGVFALIERLGSGVAGVFTRLFNGFRGFIDGFTSKSRQALSFIGDQISSIRSAIGPLTTQFVLAITAFSSIAFGRGAIEQAKEIEEARAGLRQALRGDQEAFEAASNAIEELANRTSATRAEITRAGTQFLNLGGTVDRFRDAINLAADASAAFPTIEIESAAKSLADILGGNLGELGEGNVVLKQLQQNGELAAKGFEALKAQIGGAAEALGRTEFGRAARLEDDINHVVARVGSQLQVLKNSLTESLIPVFERIAAFAESADGQAIIKIFKQLAEHALEIAKWVGIFVSTLIGLKLAAVFLPIALAAAKIAIIVTLAVQLGRELAKAFGIWEDISNAVDSTGSKTGKIFEALKDGRVTLNDLLRLVSLKIREVGLLIDIHVIQPLRFALSPLFNFIVGAIDNIVLRIQIAFLSLRAGIARISGVVADVFDFLGGGLVGLTDSIRSFSEGVQVEDLEKKLEELSKDIGKNLGKDILGDSQEALDNRIASEEELLRVRNELEKKSEEIDAKLTERAREEAQARIEIAKFEAAQREAILAATADRTNRQSEEALRKSIDVSRASFLDEPLIREDDLIAPEAVEKLRSALASISQDQTIQESIRSSLLASAQRLLDAGAIDTEKFLDIQRELVIGIAETRRREAEASLQEIEEQNDALEEQAAIRRKDLEEAVRLGAQASQAIKFADSQAQANQLAFFIRQGVDAQKELAGINLTRELEAEARAAERVAQARAEQLKVEDGLKTSAIQLVESRIKEVSTLEKDFGQSLDIVFESLVARTISADQAITSISDKTVSLTDQLASVRDEIQLTLQGQGVEQTVIDKFVGQVDDLRNRLNASGLSSQIRESLQKPIEKSADEIRGRAEEIRRSLSDGFVPAAAILEQSRAVEEFNVRIRTALRVLDELIAKSGDTDGSLANLRGELSTSLTEIEGLGKDGASGKQLGFFDGIKKGAEDLKTSIGGIGQVGAETGQRLFVGLSEGLTKAFFEGRKAFSLWLVQFIQGMAQAIVQALILQAILSAIGGPAGAAAPLPGVGQAKGGRAGEGEILPFDQFILAAQRFGIQAFHEGGTPGFGGKVLGPMVNRDIIPALLTPEEWVIRRDATRYYGDMVMSALNRRLIPRDELFELMNMTRRAASRPIAQANRSLFQSGGKVQGGALHEESSPAPAPAYIVANDQAVNQLMAGGSRGFFDFVRDNADTMKRMMGI